MYGDMDSFSLSSNSAGLFRGRQLVLHSTPNKLLHIYVGIQTVYRVNSLASVNEIGDTNIEHTYFIRT